MKQNKKLEKRILELYKTTNLNQSEIAAKLTKEGFKNSAGKAITQAKVRSCLIKNKIKIENRYANQANVIKEKKRVTKIKKETTLPAAERFNPTETYNQIFNPIDQVSKYRDRTEAFVLTIIKSKLNSQDKIELIKSWFL